MSACGFRVYWWDGEYEGECEFPENHEGDHWDGLSWYNNEGEMTDHLHTEHNHPPVLVCQFGCPMYKPRVLSNLEVVGISLAYHPKDHEPDWTDPDFGICRTCGLGRIREITK